jgi:hypothetical protein
LISILSFFSGGHATESLFAPTSKHLLESPSRADFNDSSPLRWRCAVASRRYPSETGASCCRVDQDVEDWRRHAAHVSPLRFHLPNSLNLFSVTTLTALRAVVARVAPQKLSDEVIRDVMDVADSYLGMHTKVLGETFNVIYR